MLLEQFHHTTAQDEKTHEDDLEIALELDLVTIFFLLCRPPIEIPGLRTMAIRVVNSESGILRYGLPGKDREIPSTTAYFAAGLDFDHHRTLSKPERLRNLYAVFREGMYFLVKKARWDKGYFDLAFSRMDALGFEGNFILDPVRSSKDRKFKASLEVGFTYENREQAVVFMNKSDEVVKRVEIGRWPRRWGSMVELLGAVGRWGWMSNEQFFYHDNGLFKHWILSPHHDEVDTTTRPPSRPIGYYAVPRIVVWEKFWKMKGLK